MSELYIEKFIREHPADWEQILSKPPFCISTKRDGDYFLLKYSQLDSDFSDPLVRECRGVIFHNTDGLVCLPFTKFFNYGEKNAADIDWASATVTEKIDGSLMKVWYHNGWHLSTNNTIDAFSAQVSDADATFGDMFEKAAGCDFADFCRTLDKTHVYMFELISPDTRVVIDYTHTNIYHLATRDMVTRQEIDEDIGCVKPECFPFRSVDDVLNAAKKLDRNHEGFVVCDRHYNRVKIKGDEYLAAAHLNNNGVLTDRRIIRMWQNEQIDDFLAYVPSQADKVTLVLNAIKRFEEEAECMAEDAIRECPEKIDVAIKYGKTLPMQYIGKRYSGIEMSADTFLRGSRMPFILKVVNAYRDKQEH